MQKKPVFRDNQEVTTTDFNNISDFAQEALDQLVLDAVTGLKRFSGFTVTEGVANVVTVAPGRLYSAGAVYAAEAATDFNLSTNLPVTTRKIVSVVIWGVEQDTQVKPRDFLLDVDSNNTEPQAVATERHRVVTVELVAGVESADPQVPGLADGAIAVAHLVLSPTKIEAIERVTANEVPSAEINKAAIAVLKAWRGQVGPQLDALTTTIAGLGKAVDGKADAGLLTSVAGDLARLKEEQGLPDGYAAYASDDFGSDDETDQAKTGATAVVKDGLLFPPAAEATINLDLFTPQDALASVSADGLVLPANDEKTVLEVEGYAGEILLSNFAVQAHVLRKKQIRKWYRWAGRRRNWSRAWLRRRWPKRYGSKWFWKSTVVARNGLFVRLPTSAYEAELVTTGYSGAVISQTFVAPRAMWLTSLGLFFTDVAAAGDLHVSINDTELGKPDLEAALATVSVPVGDLKKNQAETAVPLPPIWLEAGKRYAITLISEGAHKLAYASGNSYSQGTLFYGADGAFQTQDLQRDLKFSLKAAEFKAPRTELVLQTVDLAGGINDVEIDTEIVAPDGTELEFECQVNGVWAPLTQADRLTANPNTLPLRAVFLGTSAAAPCLQTGVDRVTVSRSADAFTHFSSLRNLGAPSSDIRVQLTLDGFDGADHTIDCRLVETNDTEIVADSSSSATVVDEEGESQVVATFLFTPAGLSDYRIKIDGTKAPAAAPFAVTERVDVAM